MAIQTPHDDLGSLSTREEEEEKEKERSHFDSALHPHLPSPSPTAASENDHDDTDAPEYYPTSEIQSPRERSQQRPDALAQVRSRSSARSQRSYAGVDGYTYFSEDEDGVLGSGGEGRGLEKREGEVVGVDPEKRFEVLFEGDEDPLNPKSMSYARKWLVVIIVSCGSLCVAATSAFYTSTYAQIEKEFHVSREVATLGLSLFVMGLGIGPMLLGPLSEFYGRKPIYIVSFSFFFIWIIPCAVAPNIATVLVCRFLDGFSGSAFLSVAGGTVGDLFNRSQLSLPMLVYTGSPFIGPELGPIVGGFINQYTNWRWTFYVLLIWAGIQLLAIVLLVPETYHPVLLRRKAVKIRRETGDERYRAPIEVMNKSVLKTVAWSCIRPFQLLFFEQMCLNLCLLSALLLGFIYLFFGAFPLVFQGNHGFTQSQTGLSFIGILVGMVIGISCDPLWRRNYARLVENNGGVSEPEFRLPPTILGAILVPIGLFGFGWTTYSSVHWVVPIVFSGVFGLGNIFSFSGIFTFLVECYPLFAASALAANSFARSSFAAAFPLFGVQMYEKLGYQWASSLLGFLALAMTPFPYLFFKFGKRWRATSKFARA